MDFNAMFSDATAGFHFGDLLNLGSILRILFTLVAGLIVMKIVMALWTVAWQSLAPITWLWASTCVL